MNKWFAEELTWHFHRDASLKCPECENELVNVRRLLTEGWAKCSNCKAEYTATIVLEKDAKD